MTGASDAREPRVLPEIHRLRPWYHDFSRLGLETRFESGPWRPERAILGLFERLVRGREPGAVEKGQRLLSRASLGIGTPSHLRNQRVKEAVLIPFLRRCLEELGERPSCLDLFCADGYYSCTIASLAPSARVTGIDLDEREIERARTAARVLELPGAEFVCADADRWIEASRERFDLIFCAGGLYHLSRPELLLARLSKISVRYLVLQSVVSLENQELEYFEAPAPGWRHGSRFSHDRLVAWLGEYGWEIVDQLLHELPGNRHLRDRGSSCFICRRCRRAEAP